VLGVKSMVGKIDDGKKKENENKGSCAILSFSFFFNEKNG
jgi:hypothetical protein